MQHESEGDGNPGAHPRTHAARQRRLMACYCGQSQRGVWDVRGILHTASECRFRDHLVSPTYAYI